MSADPKMKQLIELIGDFNMCLNTGYFPSLVRSIVGQQLSVKAASTIWHRLTELCSNINPEALLSFEDETLKSAGLSKPKVKYVKDLSEKILTKEIVLEGFASKPDEEIINDLTKIKGIGRWTAEMFLIFSLGRPDILAVDDVGLKRAIKWLYKLEDSPGKDEMILISEKWKPYRSVASLYLWEAINRGHL